MKVLQVIDSGGLYGAERVLLALMDELKNQSIDCSLASIAELGLPEKALETEAKRRGLDVRRITMAAGPDRNASRKLVATAVREGFDLFHTHGYKANTLIAGMSKRKRGLPAIATLHGWTASRRLTRMGMYEMAERLALRRADMVVVVSEAMARKWRLGFRYGDRLRVIRNGIPVPERGTDIDPLPERIRSFIAGRRSILAAGRLSHEKGFDVLLDALAAIRIEGLDACAVIVGEGDERANLEAQARRLGIGVALLMPGYVENAGQLMRGFDAVAIPSRTEGLPVVLLEALMTGTRVAATAVGEMPAVIKSCRAGACAESEDVIGFTNVLLGQLQDPGGDGLCRDIVASAKRLHSSQAMVAAYLDQYRELTELP